MESAPQKPTGQKPVVKQPPVLFQKTRKCLARISIEGKLKDLIGANNGGPIVAEADS